MNPFFIKKNKKKKKNHLETTKLNKYQIKCPYCRNVQNTLIKWDKDFDKINGINWPPNKWQKNNFCSFVYKKGKKKNEKCGIKCVSKFCKKHSYKKCQCVLKSGKNKGQICNAKSNFSINSKNYCKRHFKIYNKNQNI